jgi:hypothetical protein
MENQKLKNNPLALMNPKPKFKINLPAVIRISASYSDIYDDECLTMTKRPQS